MFPLTIYGQSISYEAYNQPLKSILDGLKVHYDIHFSYDYQQIQAHQVSIYAKNEDIHHFLTRLLRPQGLGFKIYDKNYIIIRPIQETGLTLNFNIQDKHNQNKLPFATIQIKGSQKGVVSDKQGSTILQIDHPDTTQLLISHIGYKTLEINALEFYKLNTKNIHLEPDNVKLQEITILEPIQKLLNVENNVFSVDLFPQKINTSLGLGTPDLQYSIQLIPGISNNLSTANHVQFRGSRDDQGLIYWDRIPIYHPTHHFGTLSSIIPNMVERIHIYRSGPPVKFGGTSAGLIEMLAPYEMPERINGVASIDMTQTSIYATLPISKHQNVVYIALRNSDNYWFNTPTFRSFQERLFDVDNTSWTKQNTYQDDFQPNSSESRLKFADYKFKWVNHLSNTEFYSLSSFFSRNSQSFFTDNSVISDSSEHHHQVNNIGVNLFWQKEWTKTWKTNLSASFTQYQLHHQNEPYHQEAESPSAKQETYRQNKMSNLEINLESIFNISDEESLSLGIQTNHIYSWADLQKRDSLTKNIDHEIESNGGIYSAFINYDWHKIPKWRIETGFRYQYFHFLRSFSWNPNIRISYEASDWWHLKFAYGVYDQYLHSLSDIEFNVNPLTENLWTLADGENLPLLANSQMTIGGVFKRKGWLIDVEAYYKNLRGLVIMNLRDKITEQTDHSLAFFQGKGNIWGLDILLNKRIHKYEGTLSYSYAKANHSFKELFDVAFPSFWDIRHQIRFAQELTLGNFDISFIWSYQSGLPYSKPIGLVHQENTQTSENYVGIKWQNINTKRLPAIHRLDASLWYNFAGKNKESGLEGRLGLSLLNVYQRRNIWNRVFYPKTFIENDQATIYQSDRRSIPFTMNLSLEVSF